jgi:hypothetical protein
MDDQPQVRGGLVDGCTQVTVAAHLSCRNSEALRGGGQDVTWQSEIC